MIYINDWSTFNVNRFQRLKLIFAGLDFKLAKYPMLQSFILSGYIDSITQKKHSLNH